jgi:hypothetical protein
VAGVQAKAQACGVHKEFRWNRSVVPSTGRMQASLAMHISRPVAQRTVLNMEDAKYSRLKVQRSRTGCRKKTKRGDPCTPGLRGGRHHFCKPVSAAAEMGG